MGMFDYLRCEYPLPDEKFQHWNFQTKSTPSQFMDNYLITQDGRLVRTSTTVAMTEEEMDAAQMEAEAAGHSIYPLMKMEAIEEEVPYHGDIFFYGYEPPVWVEFQARFTNGRLEWIKKVSEEGEDDTVSTGGSGQG